MSSVFTGQSAGRHSAARKPLFLRVGEHTRSRGASFGRSLSWMLAAIVSLFPRRVPAVIAVPANQVRPWLQLAAPVAVASRVVAAWEIPDDSAWDDGWAQAA